MKCLFYFIVIAIAANSDATNKPLFLPRLPVGEYIINTIALLRCELSTDRFQFNYYLSKTSVNTTEVKGNATYNEPLDDSYNIEINLAVKDSVGGWRDNAHIFKTPKACSSLKMCAGPFWTTFTEKIGMHNVNCPIPAGRYISSGLKLNSEMYANLPKQFFYGTYKFRFQLTKNKLNGTLTVSENIADSGGLNLAYYEYREWVKEHRIEPRMPGLQEYTPQQMFWLGLANVFCAKKSMVELIMIKYVLVNHSPFPFRIFGSFSNMKAFSDDFRCPLGSNMNPANKCQVWS